MADIPQIARLFPIDTTTDRIPEARGIHALTTVIRSFQQIFRPEKMFFRIEDQHRVVRDGAAIVVQIMWALRLRVIGAAVDGKVPAVINGEMSAVQMLMLGQVRSAIEFDAGGVRPPSIAEYDLVDSGEMPMVRKFFRTR